MSRGAFIHLTQSWSLLFTYVCSPRGQLISAIDVSSRAPTGEALARARVPVR